MKPATVTIPEDRDEALAPCGRERGVPAELGDVIDPALRDQLAEHGSL
jgi:hypothetical protein